MGKLALALVAAIFVAAAFTIYSQRKTSLETDKQQGIYQTDLLARQAAEAGLGMALSRAKRDFDAWRTGYDEAAYEGGQFDVDVQGSAAGPVVISASGTYGDSEHQVQARLARLTPSPAAVIVDADTVEVSFLGNNFRISGKDTRPGSGDQARREGNGAAAFSHGVWTRNSVARAAFLAAASGDRAGKIRGLGANSDIAQGYASDMEYFPVNLNQLGAEADSRVDQSLDGGTYNNNTYGEPDDPQVVVVNGSAVFSGSTQGYGLLVVRGNLTMQDDFEWEGIVLARSEDAEVDVVLANNASIYGALVVRHAYDSGEESSPPPDEECECPPPPAGPPAGTVLSKNGKKVTICHVPPGNPANAHTITISINAFQTHMDHHDDYDGECLPAPTCSCSDPPGGEGSEEGSPPGILRFTMRETATIQYSTEAIGKLAARLPAVKEAAWIVKFDQVGKNKVRLASTEGGDGVQ